MCEDPYPCVSFALFCEALRELATSVGPTVFHWLVANLFSVCSLSSVVS
jgi:hypothetical protein